MLLATLLLTNTFFTQLPAPSRAAKPPEVVIDSSSPAGTVLRAAFTEGNNALAISDGNLTAGVRGGAPLTRAVVRITNPYDAPVEMLGLSANYTRWFGGAYYGTSSWPTTDGHVVTYYSGSGGSSGDDGGDSGGPGIDVVAVSTSAATPAAWVGRLTITIDEATGTLTVDAPLRRGEELLDSLSAPTTYAIRDALRNVTYTHGGKSPDLTTRGISFEVFDSDGVGSAPSTTLVDIAAVNNPAVLDLNGQHRPGVDYSVAMGENERYLGVSLADADLFIGDEDGRLIVGGRIIYEGIFPDGADAEFVELSLRGSSVIGGWNPFSQSYELQGSDTLKAYRDILASARYINKGKVNEIMNQLPATKELVFTAGARVFRFEIQDSGGAVTVARTTVSVTAVARKGDPLRDENLAAPKECSGFGRRDVMDQLGTGDPEACICNAGHAGDACEIHPCNYRGQLAGIDGDGMITCACDQAFGGNACAVACGGNGEFNIAVEACECFAGWAGRLCDIKCAGCDGAHGTCSLTAMSEDSWIVGKNSYGLIVTTCVCDEWWMGGNCTIPCPCARGGFAKGTCGVDNEKLAAGIIPDEDLGVCNCETGYVGKDCTISCPPCTANNGDCVPPKGLEDGIGAMLNFILVDSTLGTDEVRAAALLAAYVTGLCECRYDQRNFLGGMGSTGDDCSVACYPCDKGTCQADGTCACLIGYSGGRCDLECAGHGVMLFPAFNETYNDTVFDVLPGVDGNDNMLNSGLFDVVELYGTTGLNITQAYCACGWMRNVEGEVVEMTDNQIGINPLGGVGWTGVFCEVPCAKCNNEKGRCRYDGKTGVCECFMDLENNVKSQSLLLDPDQLGLGFTGPGCEIPCSPCYNGTCSNVEGSYGQCLCDPGYSDAACLIECGSPNSAMTLLGKEYIGEAVQTSVIQSLSNSLNNAPRFSP